LFQLYYFSSLFIIIIRVKSHARALSLYNSRRGFGRVYGWGRVREGLYPRGGAYRKNLLWHIKELISRGLTSEGREGGL